MPLLNKPMMVIQIGHVKLFTVFIKFSVRGNIGDIDKSISYISLVYIVIYTYLRRYSDIVVW